VDTRPLAEGLILYTGRSAGIAICLNNEDKVLSKHEQLVIFLMGLNISLLHDIFIIGAFL
jgi:hypothetical protein